MRTVDGEGGGGDVSVGGEAGDVVGVFGGEEEGEFGEGLLGSVHCAFVVSLVDRDISQVRGIYL